MIDRVVDVGDAVTGESRVVAGDSVPGDASWVVPCHLDPRASGVRELCNPVQELTCTRDRSLSLGLEEGRGLLRDPRWGKVGLPHVSAIALPAKFQFLQLLPRTVEPA